MLRTISCRPILLVLSLSLWALLNSTSSAAFAGQDSQAASLLERAQWQQLHLPPGIPDRFQVRVVIGGQVLTLVLERSLQRAPDFQVFAADADGLHPVDPGPERSYRGRVLEIPSAVVAASRMPEGLRAAILERDQPTWFVQPARELDDAASPGMHLVYRHADDWGQQFRCGSEELEGDGSPGVPRGASPRTSAASRTPWMPLARAAGGGGVGPRGGSDCTKMCDMAWDADYEMYVLSGSNVPSTVAAIESVMNAVEIFYARDALISYEIGDIIVRVSEPDPYDDLGFGRLGEFVNEWNLNHTDIDRDLAHLAAGPGSLAGSGVAYLAVVCSDTLDYGMSGFAGGFGSAVAVTGHELGHNWSAPHCLDPACVSMCGACEQIGELATTVMMSHRDSRACLNDGVDTFPNLPPRAREDEVALDELAAQTIDVLANDYDVNCDLVSIQSWDGLSEAGGSIDLSPGTGPGGRDELLYTPPLDPKIGPDFFQYVATDPAGALATGNVVVYDPRPDLIAHYKLNEKPAKQVAADRSGNGHDGRYEGSVVKRQPPAHPDLKYSVDFDGVDGRVEIPNSTALSRLRRNFSVSAWINPDTNDNMKIVSNPGLWSFGISTTSLWFVIHGFGYTISDDLIPAGIQIGVWQQVGVTVDDNLVARFYVDGQPVGARDVGVPRRSSSGQWFLGTEGSNRFYNGLLDEVQIYEAKLSSRQMQLLFDSPGVVLCGSSWSLYGSGHPGMLGVPDLWIAGANRQGETFRVKFDNSAGVSTLGVLFLGFGTSSAPLFGGELLVDIFDLVVLPIPVGGGNLPLSIPDDPITCGLRVYFQTIESDAAAVGGYSFTRGMQVEIGN